MKTKKIFTSLCIFCIPYILDKRIVAFTLAVDGWVLMICKRTVLASVILFDSANTCAFK